MVYVTTVPCKIFITTIRVHFYTLFNLKSPVYFGNNNCDFLSIFIKVIILERIISDGYCLFTSNEPGRPSCGQKVHFLQGSVVTQTVRWPSHASSSCKFPIVYSRQ